MFESLKEIQIIIELRHKKLGSLFHTQDIIETYEQLPKTFPNVNKTLRPHTRAAHIRHSKSPGHHPYSYCNYTPSKTIC